MEGVSTSRGAEDITKLKVKISFHTHQLMTWLRLLKVLTVWGRGQSRRKCYVMKSELLQVIYENHLRNKWFQTMHRGPELLELMDAGLVETVMDGQRILGFKITGRGIRAALGKAKS